MVNHISARHLRDINPDLLFGDDQLEQRTYNFIRGHFDRHQTIPSPSIIRENTGVVMPDVGDDQPVDYYLNRCKQRALTRNIISPYEQLQEALQAPRTSMNQIEEAIEDLYQTKMRFLNQGTGVELSSSLIEDVVNASAQRRMMGSLLSGITTGYDEVDMAMDGYNRDDLVVWVARPGRAKSWFLLRQAYKAWSAGYKPLYVSMEMGGIQNMRRLIGIHSGINPTLIKRGRIGTLSQPFLDRAAAELLALRPLHMVTANFSRTVDQIANFIEEYQPDICYIDAGYLLSPRKKRYGSSGRRETISDVVEELKELSGNYGIPIVITVQFNRNAEQRRRGSNQARAEGGGSFDPIAHLSLAEIGETDVIGQAASHVLGIEFPPSPLPNNAYRVFGFLKGREGESGWWLTNFMQHQYSPVNLDIVPRDHPVYQTIMNGGGNARQRPAGQRSAAMSLQD